MREIHLDFATVLGAKVKDFNAKESRSIAQRVVKLYEKGNGVVLVSDDLLHQFGDGYKLEQVDGIMRTPNGEDEHVPAYYCSKTKTYYVRRTVYSRRLAHHKRLIANYVVRKGNPRRRASYAELNQQSILMLCGYNVAAESGLTDIDRHRIIEQVIDTGVCDIYDVISFIEYLVDRAKGYPQPNADAKRVRDLRYIRTVLLKKYLIKCIIEGDNYYAKSA